MLGVVEGRSRGFSVVELMISIVILTVLMGALMTFMGRMQQRYTQEQKVGGVNQLGKTAFELLAIDLGQAGFPAVVNTLTASTPVTGSMSYQNVNVLNSNGMFLNRVVTVDTGANLEAVRITAISGNTITGLFKLNHAASVPVRASMNPYPQGLLSTATYPSTATTLRILGDLRGDGSLRYIEYRFTANATNCTGTLVRSDTDAFQSTQSAAVTIADNLCNDATNGLFAYTPAPTTLGQFTYVTNVVVTLQMRTQATVERGAGGTRTVIMRQTFSPRNVLYAQRLAQDGLQTVLPVAPGTVVQNLPAAP